MIAGQVLRRTLETSITPIRIRAREPLPSIRRRVVEIKLVGLVPSELRDPRSVCRREFADNRLHLE